MASPTLSILNSNRASAASAVAGNPLWLSVVVIGGAYLILDRANGVLPATVEPLAVLSLGMLGVALLLAPARRPLRRPGSFVLLLVGAGSLIAVETILASKSMALAARELVPLCFLFLTAAGLARQFHVRELVTLTLAVTSTVLAAGIAWEVAAGVLEPHRAGYEFTGSTTPHLQGTYCSLLVLGAISQLRRARGNLGLYLGIAAVGLLFLLLTRSTASCGAFLLALLVLLALQAARGSSESVVWWSRPARVLGLVALTALIFPASEGGISDGELGGGVCLVVAGWGFLTAWRRFQLTDEEGYRTLAAQLVIAIVHAQLHGGWAISLCWVLSAAGLASLALTPLMGAGGQQVSARGSDPTLVPA